MIYNILLNLFLRNRVCVQLLSQRFHERNTVLALTQNKLRNQKYFRQNYKFLILFIFSEERKALAIGLKKCIYLMIASICHREIKHDYYNVISPLVCLCH